MPRLKNEYDPALVVANGENAAGGYGITRKVLRELFKMGVDVITGGNHIYDKREIETWIDEESRLVRPANYPSSAPGKGWVVLPAEDSMVAVVNLQGRVTMPPCECPFRTMGRLLRDLEDADAVVVDLHAEATSEKEAFGLHFDGKIAAVVGTHTHVQTADEKILPGGTAYISDLGMTGGTAGVIGYRHEDVMVRFLDGIPRRLEPEKENQAVMGVCIEIEGARAKSIERFGFFADGD